MKHGIQRERAACWDEWVFWRTKVESDGFFLNIIRCTLCFLQNLCFRVEVGIQLKDDLGSFLHLPSRWGRFPSMQRKLHAPRGLTNKRCTMYQQIGQNSGIQFDPITQDFYRICRKPEKNTENLSIQTKMETRKKICMMTRWWFNQSIWKIWIKLDHLFPQRWK